MNTGVLAVLSILLSVAAQFALKAGMSAAALDKAGAWLPRVLLNKWIWLGFAAYGLGAVLWLGVLSKWDVSKAYPLVGGGFAAALLVGHLLGESVGLLRIAGVGVICVGIAMVSRT